MFKKLVFGGFFLALFSLQQVVAQDAPAQTRTERRGRNMQDVDPKVRAQKMTDRMTKQLALDDATSKKVYTLMLARAEKMDAIHKNSDDRKAKMQAMKTNADEFKGELKNVLTPDQFAKFESMQSQMRKGRGQGRFNHDKTDESGKK
ncbi:DUF4890 domain-containing protein [Spirosoma daeguense]